MKNLIEAIRNKLTGSLVLKIVGWVVSILFVLFAWFLVEIYNYRTLTDVAFFVLHRPLSMMAGILLTTILYGTFIFAFRKTWVAALVLGVIYQAAGIVHYLKVDLNGDPFVPMDFTMTGKMGELMSFVKVTIPWWAYMMPIALALYVVILWLWQRELPRGIYGICSRVAGVIVLPLLLVLFMRPSQVQENFVKFGMSYSDAALQSSNYRSNGFLGAFLLNFAAMRVEPPEGYSKEAVTEYLSSYSATDGETDPDIIVFLCESYWDVRKLEGTTFSTDPLYFYDELCKRENAYSGTLYTTALGGGTVRPEFDVLTGLTTDDLPSGASPYIYAKENVPGYVSDYKARGYKTIAMHPYDKSFYFRNQAYPSIGFDEFYGHREIMDQLGAGNYTYHRNYFSDDSFVDAIIQQLEKNKDEPTFLFGLSMENHQTYYPLDEYELTVENPAMDEELLKTVNTYAQGVYHSTKALEKLVNYIDNREKETILIFFGDHLPTLGGNYAAYETCGLFKSGDWEHEQRKVMYGTPYVVYGNYDLQDGVFQKEGTNEISTYYLISAAALSGGADRTPYMNWLLDQHAKIPYYNVRLTMPKTEDVLYLKKAHQLLTYDRLLGARYSSE